MISPKKWKKPWRYGKIISKGKWKINWIKIMVNISCKWLFSTLGSRDKTLEGVVVKAMSGQKKNMSCRLGQVWNWTQATTCFLAIVEELLAQILLRWLKKTATWVLKLDPCYTFHLLCHCWTTLGAKNGSMMAKKKPKLHWKFFDDGLKKILNYTT